jgi:hypothetical protein
METIECYVQSAGEKNCFQSEILNPDRLSHRSREQSKKHFPRHKQDNWHIYEPHVKELLKGTISFNRKENGTRSKQGDTKNKCE